MTCKHNLWHLFRFKSLIRWKQISLPSKDTLAVLSINDESLISLEKNNPINNILKFSIKFYPDWNIQFALTSYYITVRHYLLLHPSLSPICYIILNLNAKMTLFSLNFSLDYLLFGCVLPGKSKSLSKKSHSGIQI